MAVVLEPMHEDLLRVCKNSGRITLEDIKTFNKKARKRDLLNLNTISFKIANQNKGQLDSNILNEIAKVVNEANNRSDVYVLGKDIQVDADCKYGNVSDGYHTFNELYEYRLLYNAGMCNALKDRVIITKSKKHSDGELCFGGGWFVVTMELPTGQVTNHYEMKDWDYFKVDEVETAPEWDGHTPYVAKERLEEFVKNM